MLIKLYEELKGNPALAIATAILVIFAYISGLLSAKYVFEAFSLQVVGRDSFVFKNDIEKDYTPSKNYAELLFKLQEIEKNRDNLKAEVETLKKSESGRIYSQGVCNRIALEINNYITWHAQASSDAQKLTSAFSLGLVKSEEQKQSDERQANDKRRYAEQLNQQLTKLREDFSRCIETNNMSRERQ